MPTPTTAAGSRTGKATVLHTGATPGVRTSPAWPVQRMLFLIAGCVVLLGVLLTVLVSPWFVLLPALVGANQLLFAAVGWCPMSLLLIRLGARDPQCSR